MSKKDSAATAASAAKDTKATAAKVAGLREAIADAAIAHLDAHDSVEAAAVAVRDGKCGRGALDDAAQAAAVTREVLRALVADYKAVTEPEDTAPGSPEATGDTSSPEGAHS